MIVAVGIDLIEIDRVKKLITTYPDQLNRIFTQKELRKASDKRRTTNLAELFAAKEAVFKVLGTGWQKGLNWTDIEIAKPNVVLKEKAKKIARLLKIASIQVDFSSTKTKAVAHAIGVRAS